jgi:hypothetical protein
MLINDEVVSEELEAGLVSEQLVLNCGHGVVNDLLHLGI